jgi:hypothetical protein
MSAPIPDGSDFWGDHCILPLKVGDHLWGPLLGDGTRHALFIGQFGDHTNMEVDSTPHESVVTSKLVDSDAAFTVVERLSLEEFIASVEYVMVRSYRRRTHKRLISVERALRHIGARVDISVAQTFPEVIQWWAIFHESQLFNSSICAEQSRESRYKLTPVGDVPLDASVAHAVLAGGVVEGVRVRKEPSWKKQAKSGAKLLEKLRLKNLENSEKLLEHLDNLRAAGVVGKNFASSTDLLVPSSQKVGGGLGGMTAFATVASLGGLESFTVLGGAIITGSGIALGAVALGGAAYATKKVLELSKSGDSGVDCTAEYHDCPFWLHAWLQDVRMHGYKFPPEDSADDILTARSTVTEEKEGRHRTSDSSSKSFKKTTEWIDSQRLPVLGWYVARV